MATAKKAIPKALKTAVWLTYAGKKFETKCFVSWCKTLITPFTFEAGHNVPESKGGATNVQNLRPVCSQCNKSMGNRFTIDEFSKYYGPKEKKNIFKHITKCFYPQRVAPEFSEIPSAESVVESNNVSYTEDAKTSSVKKC